MDLLETLTSQLSGANLANLSTQLGTDQGQTQSAVSAALPLLLGALNKQADSNADAVAQVADQQANDSALEDIGGFLSKSDNGAGPALVSQLFGGQRSGAEQGIAQVSGLSAGSASSLLENLAPIVIGMLGKQRQAGGLDAGGLAGLIGQMSGQSRQGANSGTMGLLGTLLDRDGDGSVIDDVAGMIGGFLKK